MCAKNWYCPNCKSGHRLDESDSGFIFTHKSGCRLGSKQYDTKELVFFARDEDFIAAINLGDKPHWFYDAKIN